MNLINIFIMKLSNKIEIRIENIEDKEQKKNFYRLIIKKDDKLETIINSYQEPNLYKYKVIYD